MGKRVVRPVVVGFVVSVSLVILASFWGDGATRNERTMSDWEAAVREEPGLPDWLLDYNLHAHLVGVIYRPPDRTPNLAGLSESQMLMDSLSPGVRASYEGALLERDEARHAAFAKQRLRWMRERASGK